MWNPFKRKETPYPYANVAEQVALAVKSISYPSTQPTWRLYGQSQEQWRPQFAIREGYQASSVVYAAVEKRAKLIASVPWVVKVRSGEDWEDAPSTHPLQRLINNPNPDQSCYEFMYSASQSLDLTGNSFISEIKAGSAGLPVELWQFPTRNIKIKAGRERLVQSYEYHSESQGRIVIDADDMIQLRMPNPDSPLWGMPPLMAAGQATDIDREAGAFQKVSLQNRGLSDLSVELPEGATPEQADYVRDKLKERQTGPANARAPIVSSGKVTQLNQTAAEMDFVNSRKAVWSEIAAVFGVPLSTLGFTENVNLANAESMDKQLWQNTIIPQLELIKRQLNSQLAVEFGADIELTFDISNVTALQEDMGKKLENAVKLWGMGYPANVINQKLELGFDEIPGGDIGYIPTGVLPASFGDDEPEVDENGETVEQATGGAGKVQDAALNGAQISSLLQIVQSVANGELPPESAIGLLESAFPTLDATAAEAIIKPAINFVSDSGRIDEQTEKRLIKALCYGNTENKA